MIKFLKKLLAAIAEIIKPFLKGEFSIGLYYLSRRFPRWLFCFDKASILCTDNYIFPENTNPDIKVRIADYSDIDEIYRISSVSKNRIRQMMDSGARCFMASIKDNPPSSVTWSANGTTYVKGLAFKHNVGKNGYYSYGAYTLPEARRKGIYLKIKSEMIKYEIAQGGNKFYGTIQFLNTYSYSIQKQLGFQPILKLIYIKIFFLQICIVKNISSNKFQIRFIFREPKGKIINI